MRKITIVCALMAVGLCSCAELSNTQAHSRPKVLVIGIDGLRPDALEAARTPNLDSLIADGAYSSTAQAGFNTVSGPGWSNLLTGVWAHKHGVADNEFTGSDYTRYPSFFSRIEELRPQLVTASLISWKPIHDHIVRKADIRIYHDYKEDGDRKVTDDAVRILTQQDPDAIFLYYADVDIAGHDHGFNPNVAEYIAEIEEVDGQIGRVLKALRSRTTARDEDWLILSSTDHGGIGTGHGGGRPQQRTIYYIASGPSAARGTITPAPYQVDIAATALAHLGITADPAWELDGRPAGLRGARPPGVPPSTAIIPRPRGEPWLKRHAGFVQTARKGNVDVLLLGDSITDAWRSRAVADLWKQQFEPLKAANFGISGDRTQHVLWRITRGELEGISPKVVMLMIGTNNSNRRDNTAGEIADGVTAIVRTIRRRLPETRIMLLGIFPRGQKPNPQRDKITAVNDIIKRLDDGSHVRYHDIGAAFLEPDGTISRKIMPDYVHLTPEGYRRWAEAVMPLMKEMLGE